MIKNTRKGFTITELVIVIAVIAILAAVLIPTFSSIITKANNSADLQKARNIMTEYMAEKDAQVKDTFYVKVDNDTYFKVQNGQLAKTPIAAAPTDVGTVIVSADSDDTDKVPDETEITEAPANPTP